MLWLPPAPPVFLYGRSHLHSFLTGSSPCSPPSLFTTGLFLSSFAQPQFPDESET